MFGGQHNKNTVQCKHKITTTSRGDIDVYEFTMQNLLHIKHHTLFVVVFSNIEQIDDLTPKVKLHGIPGRNDFYAPNFAYVGVDKFNLVHINFFNQTFQAYILQRPPDTVAELLGRMYGSDMRDIMYKNLLGSLTSFGYDKDNRQWTKLSFIENQNAVGEIATFRTFKATQNDRIRKQLNKLFPDGKRVSSTTRD